MRLTKTQINYLEDKLERVVLEKISEFKNKLGKVSSLDKVVLEKLQNGEIKFLPEKDLFKRLGNKYNTTYCGTIYLQISDMISDKDRNKIKKGLDDTSVKIGEYTAKMYKAKQEALDKIILRGVDFESVLRELNRIK